MKLILFGASVFYLLGLKLTSQIHVNQPLLSKPAAIESKSFQENKAKNDEKIAKPEITVKDTTISAGKANQAVHKIDQKNIKSPITKKGAV
jgi:hypothetical protein